LQTRSPPGHEVATQRVPTHWVADAAGQVAHSPAQTFKVLAHAVATQRVPSQAVAVEPVGQRAHVSPHARYPCAQSRPHWVPSQVGVPFVEVGHALQRPPHVASELSETQVLLQRCVPGEQPQRFVAGSQKPGCGHSASDPDGQRRPHVPFALLQMSPPVQPVRRHPASTLPIVPPSLRGGTRHTPPVHAWPPAQTEQACPAMPHPSFTVPGTQRPSDKQHPEHVPGPQVLSAGGQAKKISESDVTKSSARMPRAQAQHPTPRQARLTC
jgi:hypothetical protein